MPNRKGMAGRMAGLARRMGTAARRVVVWYEGQPQPVPEPGVVVIHVSERVGAALDKLSGVASPDRSAPAARRTVQQVMDAEGDDIYRTVLTKRLYAATTDEERAALRAALDELLPEALAEASEDAPARQEAAQKASGQELVRPATKDEPRPTLFERGIQAVSSVLARDTFTGRLPDISLATGRPVRRGLMAEVERFRHAEGPESDALRDALQGLDDNAAAGRSGPVLWGEEYDDG